MRLDVYLSESGLAKSRSFAKTLVDEGYVTVDGQICKKPSFEVDGENSVKVIGTPYEYVSRGGVKLAFALDSFGVSVQDAVCVDIGASSGGFTDCLLRRGAKRVYAVDSGTNQLSKSLAEDKRVVKMENCNARYLTPEKLGEACSVAVMDVSFISQTLIIPAVKALLRPDGFFVSLVKPQFECGREGLGKGGIVRNKSCLCSAVKKVIDFAEKEGLGCTGLVKSPVTGGDGNTEFLIICRPNEERRLRDGRVEEICLG